jgi:hypothetical protein
MNTIEQTHLADVAAQVLETAAFACGFQCQRDELPPVDEALASRVRFAGPRQGEILIAAPVALCRLLAANSLSLDETEVEPETAADCLSELANIVCGRWLTAQFGDEPVFRLSVPELRHLRAEDWNALALDEQMTCLLAEDQPFLAKHVSLSVDDGNPI